MKISKNRTWQLATAVAGSALLWGQNAAVALPFVFTFEATILPLELTLPGVNAGDVAIVNVIADNGGNTLISQSWHTADVTSATVSAGTYSGTFNAPFERDTLFVTNGLDQLVQTSFFDIDFGNSDSLGRSAVLTINGIASAVPGTFLIALFAGTFASDPSAWTVTQVPEPATLALLGLGLAGLGWSRRRK